MNLSTKGRYAVTAMLDMALHSDSGTISLAVIAERQAISLAYLEQIFCKLRRAGLVTSVRGPGGGYRLATSADAISIADIIHVVEEVPSPPQMAEEAETADGLGDILWQGVCSQITEFFSGVSLDELSRRESIIQIVERQDRRMSGEIVGQPVVFT